MIQHAGRTRLYAALALVGALGLAGCAGENLFQLEIVTSGNVNTLTITTPEDGGTIGLNSSLGVGFDVADPAAAASYRVEAKYVGTETAAYEPVDEQLEENLQVASVFTTMSPAAGQTTGDVYVVVELTESDGDTGRDSVKITITN